MKVALIGGASRSARAFLRLCRQAAPDIECLAFVRRADPDADPARPIVVADYAAIDADMLRGCDAVVNFAGVVRAADESEYERVNATLAVQLAEAARDAEAAHFIQLSSLAVYGRAERVERNTPTAPVSAYGRSKLLGERLLAPLDGPAFCITLLRLPAIYGAGMKSKLARLARLWRAARVLPAPRPLPLRSAIGDRNLGAVLIDLLRQRRCGTVLAADPQAFTLEDLRRALPFRAWLLPLPRVLFAPVRVAAPSLHASLLAPMEISPDCLVHPTDPPLLTTRESFAAAFGRADGVASG
jgi:nucleoside-diphosphate-sugar epimerase